MTSDGVGIGAARWLERGSLTVSLIAEIPVGELFLNHLFLFPTSVYFFASLYEVHSVLSRSSNAGRGQKSIYGQRSTREYCAVYERKFGRRRVLATRSVIMFVDQS